MSLVVEWKPVFDPSEVVAGDQLIQRANVTLRWTGKKEVIAEVVEGSRAYLTELTMPRPSDRALHWGCTCLSTSPCRHVWATLVAIERRGGALPRGAAQQEPEWKRLLDRVRRDSQPNERRRFDQIAARYERQREIWYLLDISRCYDEQGLVLQFYQREQKQNGEFGKFKPCPLLPSMQQQLKWREDRELMALLLGIYSTSNYDAGYHYSPMYSYYGVRRDALRLSESTYDCLLPRLCATGRLMWVLDSSLTIDEARPLSYDAGEPYRFRLRTEEQGEQWIVRGEFARASDSVPLDEPVFIMRDGVLILPDRVARFTGGDAFTWLAELRRAGEIAVAPKEQETFLRYLLEVPQLPEIALPESADLTSADLKPTPCICFGDPERRGGQSVIPGTIQFEYGQQRFAYAGGSSGFLDDDGKTVLLRRIEEERAFVQTLEGIDGLHVDGATGNVVAERRCFTEMIGELSARHWIVEASGRKVRRASHISMQLKSHVDWFALEGEVQFDDQSIPVPQLLAALRQRQNFVRLGDGSHGILPEEWLQRYGTLADLAEDAGDEIRFARCQTLLLDSLLAETQLETDDDFQELCGRLSTCSELAPANAPASFEGQLRHYQQEGLGWLHFLRELRLGGCLADDMGLGKTIQVLALLEERRQQQETEKAERRPSLVVVPKSLVFNWLDEAARFTPQLRVLNFTGLGRTAHLKDLGRWDLLVTTYGTLRRDILKLKDIEFDYAILDEAQAIKNAQAQAAKASRLLKARHRLAMTGTPVENHLGELWSLFEFLNPGMLGRSASFQQLTRGVTPDPQDIKMLARGLRPFLLRRTKQQVLTELPQKSEQTLYCELSKKERKYYDELRQYYHKELLGRVKAEGLAKAKIHVLEALLRLRQAACHVGLLDKKQLQQPSAKLEALLEQLKEIMAEGHKALVFSQFTSLLSIVRSAFDAQGIRYEYLDGQTRHRKRCVERFQTDPDCPLFLISLKAGGQGLNLTAADYVFILDPWWNPAVEAQAVDRAHRLGQQRHVFAYRLICRNTVEEKILELQRQKRELADAIISEDNSVLRNLTEEDLGLLFG